MSMELFLKNRPIIDSILKQAEDKIIYMTGLTCHVKATLEENKNSDYITVIINRCCQAWNVEPSFIAERSRAKNRPLMRQVICLIVKMKFPNTKLWAIGEKLGNIDHTSVIHCVEKAKDHLTTKDDLFMKYYQPVESILHEAK